MNDLISVVITTKNRINKVESAIKSVLNQTYKFIELIIVDDASTDGTSNLIRSKYPNIILQTNIISMGGSVARNIGWKISKGKFIAFLDDDDQFTHDKLEIQLKAFLSNSKLSLVVCNYYSIKRNKTFISRSTTKVNYKYYYKNIFGGSSTYFTSKKLIEQIDGFDEKLKSAQDWDFALKLSQIGNIYQCKKPLVLYEDYINIDRITNSSLNTYLGHRDIYIKYSHLMKKVDSKKLLFEVLYFRKLINKINNKHFVFILKLLLQTNIIFITKSMFKYYK